MKISGRIASLSATDRTIRETSWRSSRNRIVAPPIAETGIVLDPVEIGVGIAELLAHALDERANVRPVADFAVAADKAFAMDNIVEITVAEIAPGAIDHMPYDIVLREGQRDWPPFPAYPPAVVVEPQHAARCWFAGFRGG